MTTSLSLPGHIAQGLTGFGFGFVKAIAARVGRAVPVLVALSLVASGCANRVQDVLQPLAVAPAGTSRVTMLVATTRKPSEDPGKLFSGDRGTAISLNSVDVSIPPDRNRKIGEVQWPSRMPPNPQKEFAVTQVAKVQSEGQAFDWYRKNRNTKHQVIIFVHGFNNTYADAVFRFAQIVHDSGTDAAPILFTWPSRGRVFDYLYDKESANYSRRALEDLILQAVKSPDVSDVTILAHSMGGWLAAEALRGVAMREKSIPTKVKNVVLASPDIDIDVFRRQFTEMGPKRPHFVILTSTRDKALEMSSWLSGGVSRVGGSDLRPYAPLLDELGVSVIDTSAIATNDPLGHNAFADSPEIVRLLGRRLAGQSLEGGKASVADQIGMTAANFAGSAARVAVAAPVAVISPEAREILKRELSSNGGKMVDGQIAY
ncbi:alpha/beta fold hydrolase [Rhizobium ruizarguesonis]|jgi:esterase/lipase superfamily enzyme|uniref:Alpha/beta fold hydrolase n=1 Tax=Rhizobium ruizarguesonis TaxID=2081791 RepID=A0ABY1X5Z6_9HYPH|nr:alpha/beta hydrolase [Rhizobium ruizarguesonis]MBY5832531.1 alpha/beta hydrolase [Rhizobium leguminosarum]NKJ77591.1 alpha/beta fold hydrolase [Rhizobium leguminosarum bv. viciae]QJS26728.1 alpha/beta hydrolase [Rhizobium leguminosarum bv. trifolii TA1]MBY5861224.1 alpha/beta hydrolase [Rhizobium leguminosarum]MBY5872476.1 alpha/beta hydrolase [Rhizobium leguminosarum]